MTEAPSRAKRPLRRLREKVLRYRVASVARRPLDQLLEARDDLLRTLRGIQAEHDLPLDADRIAPAWDEALAWFGAHPRCDPDPATLTRDANCLSQLRQLIAAAEAARAAAAAAAASARSASPPPPRAGAPSPRRGPTLARIVREKPRAPLSLRFAAASPQRPGARRLRPAATALRGEGAAAAAPRGGGSGSGSGSGSVREHGREQGGEGESGGGPVDSSASDDLVNISASASDGEAARFRVAARPPLGVHPTPTPPHPHPSPPHTPDPSAPARYAPRAATTGGEILRAVLPGRSEARRRALRRVKAVRERERERREEIDERRREAREAQRRARERRVGELLARRTVLGPDRRPPGAAAAGDPPEGAARRRDALRAVAGARGAVRGQRPALARRMERIAGGAEGTGGPLGAVDAASCAFLRRVRGTGGAGRGQALHHPVAELGLPGAGGRRALAGGAGIVPEGVADVPLGGEEGEPAGVASLAIGLLRA